MNTSNAKQTVKRIRVILTSRNQLTLPVEAQEYLHTSPGIIELVLENGRAYIEPTPMKLDDVYASARPKYPLSVSWEEAEQIAKDEHAKQIVDQLAEK